MLVEIYKSHYTESEIIFICM